MNLTMCVYSAREINDQNGNLMAQEPLDLNHSNNVDEANTETIGSL